MIIVPALILAVIGLKLNVNRNKAPKLSSTLSWIITLGFGAFLTFLFFDDGYIEDILTVRFMSPDMIKFAFIELVVLLVINILTVENKVKAVVFSITQTATSIVLVVIIVLVLLAFFFGGGSRVKEVAGKFMSHTDEEERYAKANGYFDANDANQKGFDTSPANNPGFDYTQKKE